MLFVFVFVPDFFYFLLQFFVLFADVSTKEEALNTINDVLSDLGLSETPAAAEEGAPSVKGCDSVQDLCALFRCQRRSRSLLMALNLSHNQRCASSASSRRPTLEEEARRF